MTTMNGLARTDSIERAIDKPTAAGIQISPSRGMSVGSMGQAMEVAKLMACSDKAVPAHLRGNPGACLAVALQGYEWGVNPFAIANKTYVVNDRLAYESALYQAVLTRRAPIKGRLKTEYTGSGAKRQCRVYAELLEGGFVEYTSPETGNIKPKNSPLWVNDPDQQLAYFSVRSFARRHFADVMMGIYTVDEMQDLRGESSANPSRQAGAASVLNKLTNRDVSEGQTFEPDGDAADAMLRNGGSAVENDIPEIIDAETEPSQPASIPVLVDTWEQTKLALVEAAIDSNTPEGDLWARVNLWLVAKGAKGNEDKKTTPADRAALVEAVRTGRLNTSGVITD